MSDLSPGIEKRLDKTFKAMERTAMAALRREGFPVSKQRHERSLALRYKGQSFDLEIKQTSVNIGAHFHRAHRKRYGYAQESNIVEIVSARVRSSGLVERLGQRRNNSVGKKRAKADRQVMTYVDGRKMSVPVYHREQLPAGAKLRTPCIVTEYSSTTLIPPGALGEVDGYGNLIIQVT
jgi:N-methylhydantoinase A